MAPKKTYYLSKEGKTFGPYSTQEYEGIKNSKDYISFAWVWDSESPGWLALNPPPPPPNAPEYASIDSEEINKKIGDVQAICHNQQAMVSGSVRVLNRTDFVLLCEPALDEVMPIFGPGNHVVLNLLHESSGKSENAAATVKNAHRKDGGWEYEMSWGKTPSLFSLEVVR